MKYLFILLITIVSCSSPNTKERIHKSPHFKIYYTDLDEMNVEEISDSLESNYFRIVTDLQSEELPMVNVHFYTDVFNLQEGVKSVEPNLPVFAIGLATTVSEIHMLSPNHANHRFENMIENTIHEFAHCVSYKVSPNIANNPRWLWESVAIYESNGFRDPQYIRYLVDQEPPPIHELNQFSNTYIYDVGYLIAEYIIERKGKDKLIELLKNNGNIRQTLDMDEEVFTQAWFSFVKNKYGI